MKIGYVRVSSKEQITDRQFNNMVHICDEIHSEKKSAKNLDRPVYKKVLRQLKRGDTFVILSIDRAFRNTMDAISEADKLQERGVEFQIINLAIDTSNADGKLAYTVVAAVAEHERARNSERVKQGQAAARKNGQYIGRPPKMTKAQVLSAIRKLEAKEASLEELAALNDVHPWTLTRSIRRLEEKV